MTKWGHRTREDERKNELIKAKIAQKRASNPKLSFREAWYQLAAENPDWLKSDDAGWDPDVEQEPDRTAAKPADEFGEVRQPHVSYRTSAASLVECECASDVFVGGAPSEIVYLPRGRQQIRPLVSGVPKEITVEVDQDAALVLQEALKRRTRRAYGAFDHKPGPAAFHPKGFKWDAARGVVLEVEWTDAGKAAVAGKNYFGFSPTFLIAKDSDRVAGLPDSGEIGSLTNNPAFPGLDRLAASAARVEGDYIMLREADCNALLEAVRASERIERGAARAGVRLDDRDRLAIEWIMARRGYQPEYDVR
jgi:Mu-like prophage I protein